MEKGPELVVENLTKVYDTGAGKIKAVDSVSFTAKKGEVTAVVGPSGSGKTTLLYLIGSLELPTSGKIILNNENVADPKIDLIEYRRKNVGFVFQSFNLIPTLTAIENVMLPMDLAGVPPEEQKKRARMLLEQMEITGRLLNAKPGKMSGGENQRVAIARALANNPDLILADEPTGNLDTSTGDKVIGILSRLARDAQKCVIIVTHDESILKASKTAFYMKDGKIKEI